MIYRCPRCPRGWLHLEADSSGTAELVCLTCGHNIYGHVDAGRRFVRAPAPGPYQPEARPHDREKRALDGRDLTAYQERVLSLYCSGIGIEAVARTLGVSRAAAYSTLYNVGERLGLGGLAELTELIRSMECPSTPTVVAAATQRRTSGAASTTESDPPPAPDAVA